MLRNAFFVKKYRSSFHFILIVFVIAASACVSSVTAVKLSDGTLEMNLDPDPSSVFVGSKTTLYVDVENKDVKTLENIAVEIFDTGLMEAVDKNRCKGFLQSMLPNKTFSLRCELAMNTEILDDSVENKIHARASFKTKLSIIQSIEFISEEWYERLRITGLTPKPKKFAYADKNIKVTIEFSDNLPIIIRKDKKYYMYITIENVGKGLVKEIKADDIELKFASSNEIISKKSCTIQNVIYSVGDKFPRIACEITLPKVETQKTEDLILGINYNYDIRASTFITIKK